MFSILHLYFGWLYWPQGEHPLDARHAKTTACASYIHARIQNNRFLKELLNIQLL